MLKQGDSPLGHSDVSWEECRAVIFPLYKRSSGDRNRTCDTRLMSPLLYRLSYAAREVAGTGFEPATSGL
jgi:hypothetical protein